ncbi:SIMPL domain-containing protein [Methylopila sp. 73B]|uniref:SIMPL domain-containing protein n=1 Tax=Methylopila sp. 73B TaxID=1120792 RepID=UPI00035E3824|nr:SIMPL domain-containing protein [Methylopila sp. 73B]
MRACAVALLALSLLPNAAFAQETREPPAVSVTGEGVVAATPDRAAVTSGVVTRAQTAGAALAANATAMTKVFAALKAARIEDRDVATSALGLQPQYDYADGRSPKLVAYEARNAVTVRVRELDRLGALLDQLVQAGSNQLESLVFEVSDADKRLDEARKAAIADARRKAELYAEAAGAKLGEVLSIAESGGAEPPVRPQAMRAKAMDAAPAPTPVAAGEQELRVEVQARWSIVR